MAKYKQKTYIMQGGNICKNARGKYMQRHIICKGKIYAKTYNMQGENICKRPIICKGKQGPIMCKGTYNMQGQNICKDL